jgi:hypothetical protein
MCAWNCVIRGKQLRPHVRPCALALKRPTVCVVPVQMVGPAAPESTCLRHAHWGLSSCVCVWGGAMEGGNRRVLQVTAVESRVQRSCDWHYTQRMRHRKSTWSPLPPTPHPRCSIPWHDEQEFPVIMYVHARLHALASSDQDPVAGFNCLKRGLKPSAYGPHCRARLFR